MKYLANRMTEQYILTPSNYFLIFYYTTETDNCHCNCSAFFLGLCKFDKTNIPPLWWYSLSFIKVVFAVDSPFLRIFWKVVSNCSWYIHYLSPWVLPYLDNVYVTTTLNFKQVRRNKKVLEGFYCAVCFLFQIINIL